MLNWDMNKDITMNNVTKLYYRSNTMTEGHSILEVLLFFKHYK